MQTLKILEFLGLLTIEGETLNLLSMSEQFILPVIAGMNSYCLSWFLMFGIVLMKYIGLRLNRLMKPKYAA